MHGLITLSDAMSYDIVFDGLHIAFDVLAVVYFHTNPRARSVQPSNRKQQ